MNLVLIADCKEPNVAFETKVSREHNKKTFFLPNLQGRFPENVLCINFDAPLALLLYFQPPKTAVMNQF